MTVSCLVAGIALRRADLVVVAVPFAAGTVIGLSRARLGSEDVLQLRMPTGSVWEGDLAGAEVRVGGDSTFDLVVVAIEHDPGVDLEGDGTLRAVLPRPGQPAVVELAVRAKHWGRMVLGPVRVTMTAAHGLLRREAQVSRTGALTIVPLRAVFDATDAVPRAAGLVGAHRSRRPGSGTDLHTVRQFTPGDRLRRITWPVSLRTGTLHVTTTTEDRDTDVALVVDSVQNIGDADSEIGTSLDITVRAAAAVAEHYLHQGDRVGLVDLGSPRRPVRPGAGKRQMLQIVATLIGIGTSTRPDIDRVARQLRDVPHRALVMVFSTLLDEPIATQLATLAVGGRTVLVIDTLPPDVEVDNDNEWTPLAWQLALVRRDTLRRRLLDVGIPVVQWRGAGSLDAVLLGLSRAAATPRVHR